MKKILSVFLILMFVIYSNQSYVYAFENMDEFNKAAVSVIEITKKMSLENSVDVKPGEVKTLPFSKETSKIVKQLSVINKEINKMKDLMVKNKVSEKEIIFFCDLVNRNITDTFHLYPIINDLNEYIYTKPFSKSTKAKVESIVSKYHEVFKNVEVYQTENNNYKNLAAVGLVCIVVVVGMILGHKIIKELCKKQSEIDHNNPWGDIGDETGIYNPHPNNPYNSDLPSNIHDTTQHPNQNTGTNEITTEITTVPSNVSD